MLMTPPRAGWLSLPTRGRGLKPGWRGTGALQTESLPTRGRGLKRYAHDPSSGWVVVAPYTGAWIETRMAWHRCAPDRVAPYTGAWIETYMPTLDDAKLQSLPTRGRGLKLLFDDDTRLLVSRSLHGGVD